VTHPVREAGGTQTHERAFEAVATGQRPRCTALTLHWLEQRGLIERHPSDQGPKFSVPIAVHIAWCEWAAEAETRRQAMKKRLGARK